jgi:hypothetical protein
MAKRGWRPQGGSEEHGSASGAIEGFAEDLGQLLGAARAKAEGWLGQRRNVAKQLEQIRDTAAGLLNQLTGMQERRRPGRHRTAQSMLPMRKLLGERPRRKLSAKARKAISEAQKKRWAKLRTEGK